MSENTPKKVKIFAISDLHGFFSQTKRALFNAGFEENNPKHLLVVCGDVCDRGDEPYQMIEWLKSLTNVILVRGNHEELISDLILREKCLRHDFHNGTANTVYDLGNALQSHNEVEFDSKPFYQNISEYLNPFLDKFVDYFETKNYVFVHSFIPTHCSNWHFGDWDNARWVNPFTSAALGLNNTGKTIVHGHWHNSTYWAKAENLSEFGPDAKFDVCEHDNCVGLDACTAHSGKVNVFVIEDEELIDL